MVTAKRKKRIERTRSFFLALGIIGIICIIGGNLYGAYQKFKYSFIGNSFTTTQSVNPNNLPQKISIPRLSLTLSVMEGSIVNGTWNVADNAATHLYQSATPEEKGNIVIYGHNVGTIFGNLYTLDVNDHIVLTTRNGNKHEYQITKILTVLPSRIDLVNPTDYEVLTIYTCTGLFDSQRLVIQAQPMVDSLSL